MTKAVRNNSMQMEKFDRPVRSVNCYDNVLILFALSSQQAHDVNITSHRRRCDVILASNAHWVFSLFVGRKMIFL